MRLGGFFICTCANFNCELALFYIPPGMLLDKAFARNDSVSLEPDVLFYGLTIGIYSPCNNLCCEGFVRFCKMRRCQTFHFS